MQQSSPPGPARRLAGGGRQQREGTWSGWAPPAHLLPCSRTSCRAAATRLSAHRRKSWGRGDRQRRLSVTGREPGKRLGQAPRDLYCLGKTLHLQAARLERGPPPLAAVDGCLHGRPVRWETGGETAAAKAGCNQQLGSIATGPLLEWLALVPAGCWQRSPTARDGGGGAGPVAGISGWLVAVAGCWLRYSQTTPVVLSMTLSAAPMTASPMGKLALPSRSTASMSCKKPTKSRERQACVGTTGHAASGRDASVGLLLRRGVAAQSPAGRGGGPLAPAHQRWLRRLGACIAPRGRVGGWKVQV